MKFLISDYCSSESTEPMYFNTTLNMIGCTSTLWRNNVSAFDIFDITSPDVYITHVNMLYNDTISYLAQNKNIDFVLNITGIKNEDLGRLDDILKNQNISPKFYFVNNPNHKLKSRHNIVVIPHGADMYFAPSNELTYNIEYGIIVDNASESTSMGDTYHYISNNKDLMGKVDIVLPITNLSSIYPNYKKLVFKYFTEYFRQVFFDSAYYGNSIYLDVNSEVAKQNLSKLFGEDGLCDLNNEDSGNIKQRIKNKHTCLHRVKSLISQLSAKDQIDNITKLIEERTK